MKSAKARLKVLLDAGVPDSVGHTFKAKSHEVIFHRDVLIDGSVDEMVCATAVANEAILVAIDGDMKQLAKKYGVTPKGERFDNLNLIRICCNEVQAANRIQQALDLIEAEFAFAKKKAARRMWVDVGAHHIRTNR